MYLRLRQIALVARELEPVLVQLRKVLGIEVCFRDPGIARLGLENALLPIGPVFIEVVAPVQPNTTAERYLERRKGDGGYMYIVDCDDVGRRRQHVKAMGIRIVAENKKTDWAPVESFQLHPKDTGGAILSIGTHAAGENLMGGYHWAGREWQNYVRTEPVGAVLGCDIQSDDPAALASRWSAIFERPLTERERAPAIELDLGFARFVANTDGRGEGLCAVHLKTTDRPRILAAAKAEAVPVDGHAVTICGTRFVLH
jgi:Glyoxalase-like domain